MVKRRLPALRHVRPKRGANRKANAVRLNSKNGYGPRLTKRRQSLDTFDVREWFATDPSACISERSAQEILREYEQPYRWWIKFPRKDQKRLIRSQFEKAAHVAVKQRAAHSQDTTRVSIEKKVRESAEGIRKELVGLAHHTGQALVADQFMPWWQSLKPFRQHSSTGGCRSVL